MSRVFSSPAIRNVLSCDELTQLLGDFQAYVGGAPCPRFGKDVLYDHPNTPRLVLYHRVRHVHLLDPDAPWRLDTPPFQRTSDHHLVYCTGTVDERCYLLMAVLPPQAHQKARRFNIMAKLGVMAERFRLDY